MENLKRLKFVNSQCPTSQFDLRKLEKAFTKEEFKPLLENLHLVEFYLIVFITKGEGFHTVDFTTYRFRAGSIFTIRKDQIHRYHISPTTEGYMIFFTEQFVSACFDEKESQKIIQLFNELLGSPKIQLSETELSDISARVKRMEYEYFNEKDEHTLSIIRSELQILIAKLSRNKNQSEQNPTDTKYLREFIRFQALVESNITKNSRVGYYAKEMGLSAKTLNAVTQNILNKSAKAFIDEIYITRIKRLLLNTEYSVKEIAYQTGFEETTNFYKFFKRQIQLTPEQFRAKPY